MKQKVKVIIGVFILIFLLIPKVKISASNNRVVRVGYYENEVFQEGAQEGKIKTGYAYEYYQKLLEYTGWQYEYVYGEFGDLYQMLLDGEIDLLAGLAKKEDRVDIIGYPDAPMGNETYNLVKHNVDEDITVDPSSLNGKKIGVLDSAMKGTLKDFLDTHKVNAEVEVFRDYEPLFEAFDKHEVDVLAAEGDGAYGRPNAELLYSFGASDYYLCVNKADSELLAELNMAQTELAIDEPNYINFLRSKYYPVSISSRAFSAAEKQWLAEHKELKVGYLNDFLPYCDTDSSGNVTGVIKDIIPRIIENLDITGLEISYKCYDSYDDMIAALNVDEIDVAFPVGGGLYYSEENGILQSGAAVSATTDIVYKGDYSENTTDSFAVNKNNRVQYYFIKTYYPSAKVEFYNSIEACLEAVKDGRVGSTTLDGLRANDMLKNSKYKKLSHLQTMHEDDRCFGVRIGDEGLLKLINRGINVLGSDYAQNMAFRYTDQLYRTTLSDMIRENAVFFGGLLFVVATVIIALLVRDKRRSKRELIAKENARKELDEALGVAVEANKAKSAFLSSMSHEIRTPMNAIIGLDNLALKNDSLQDETREYLEKIGESARHLLGLINDILDMSRIESGRLTLNKEEFSLGSILEQINTMVMSQCDEKGLKYEYKLIGDINDRYVGDEMKLKQMLINILANAIKFTEAPGNVAMTVERIAVYGDHSTVRFVIKDTGIGMDKEFIPKIFDSFAQEDSSRTSKYGSTGLGMAITKNIVELMNGSISVTSEKGVGSEFTVVVTLGNCESEDGRTAECGSECQGDRCADGYGGKRISESSAGSGAKRMSESFAGSGGKKTSESSAGSGGKKTSESSGVGGGEDSAISSDGTGSGEQGRTSLKDRRILLAEDVEINAEIIKQIILMKEATIEHAANGRIVVEMFANSPVGYYDAVLMDVRMPEMDGLEAAASIRALDRPDAKTVPIIALTANAFDEDVQRSLQVGMNAHLSKPVEPENLYRTLEELIS
ncbi:amino acid-binding domain sensor hybrid histidine kinase [Eubacterium ruminantium]|nr:amino acid-binding domain sensor hybrid histidine kinase [Eubacterium ruminantium]